MESAQLQPVYDAIVKQAVATERVAMALEQIDGRLIEIANAMETANEINQSAVGNSAAMFRNLVGQTTEVFGNMGLLGDLEDENNG